MNLIHLVVFLNEYNNEHQNYAPNHRYIAVVATHVSQPNSYISEPVVELPKIPQSILDMLFKYFSIDRYNFQYGYNHYDAEQLIITDANIEMNINGCIQN